MKSFIIHKNTFKYSKVELYKYGYIPIWNIHSGKRCTLHGTQLTVDTMCDQPEMV